MRNYRLVIDQVISRVYTEYIFRTETLKLGRVARSNAFEVMFRAIDVDDIELQSS